MEIIQKWAYKINSHGEKDLNEMLKESEREVEKEIERAKKE